LGQELLELRKMVAAKERSIDSLRDTLSSTKRSLEARAAAAEGALASREQDLARVLAEVRSPLLLATWWVRTGLPCDGGRLLEGCVEAHTGWI
jgi:hypothetical protein